MRFVCIGSGSSGNCYYIFDGEHILMLDCGDGLSWKEVLAGCDFDTINIDACLITHSHKDHLGKLRELHTLGIPIYSNDETAEFALITRAEKIKGLKERQLATINGGWKVLPWYVPHTGGDGEDCPCFAYYIHSPSGHRIVYITDFMYSPVTFKSFNVNTILVACNHDDDIEELDNSTKFRHILSGHSKLSVVKELLRQNQTEHLKNVILCHLSRENATASEMLRQVQEVVGDSVQVVIATKGTSIDLGGSK